jgi:hypothetical protein
LQFTLELRRGELLQELPELFRSESGVFGDATHGVRVHWIVPGNGHDPRPVGHHDVFALPNDPEVCLLERGHGTEVVDPGNARHDLDRDLDLSNLPAVEKVVDCGQILPNRILNVFQGFLLGRPLGPTSRKARDRYTESFLGLLERNLVFHGSSIPRTPGRLT